MLHNLDILKKNKEIRNTHQLIIWNSWIKTLPHSLLIEELKREINLLKAYSEERDEICLVRKRLGYVASTKCEVTYLEFTSAYITDPG